MKTRALIVSLALASLWLAPALSGPAAGPTPVAGVPAAQVGDNGPAADFLSGPLQLAGHADMTPPAAAKPLGNNGAVALIGHEVVTTRIIAQNYEAISKNVDPTESRVSEYRSETRSLLTEMESKTCR